jgi:hypothetical protein
MKGEGIGKWILYRLLFKMPHISSAALNIHRHYRRKQCGIKNINWYYIPEKKLLRCLNLFPLSERHPRKPVVVIPLLTRHFPAHPIR